MPERPSATAPEVTVWTDPERVGLVGAVLDVMGADIRPIGIGCARLTEVDDLAKRFDCPREDDLRKLIVERPAAFLLLATMQGVSPEDLLAAHAGGTLILTMEPPAAELQELAAARGKGEPPRMLLLPGYRHSPGFIRAADPHDMLGEPRSVAIETVGQAGEGSLFARLYDAWVTALGYVTLPESVDCSLSGPFKEPPEDLRAMAGRLATHARIADGGSVLIQACDSGSDHRRYFHIIGTQSELRVTDLNYELRQLRGGVVDRGEVTVGGIGFIELMGHQWRRLLGRPDLVKNDIPPSREKEALACCIACLLSARTGQPESPRKIIEMNR